MTKPYSVDIRHAFGATMRGMFILDDDARIVYEQGEVVVGTILSSAAIIERYGGTCVAAVLRLRRCPRANIVHGVSLVMWDGPTQRWSMVGTGNGDWFEILDLAHHVFHPDAWYPVYRGSVYNAPFAEPQSCRTEMYDGVAAHAISGRSLNELRAVYAGYPLLAPLADYTLAEACAVGGYITPTRELPPPSAWIAGTHSFVDPGGRTEWSGWITTEII